MNLGSDSTGALFFMQAMKSLLKRFIRDQSGATAIEYAPSGPTGPPLNSQTTLPDGSMTTIML
jgi:hypothetical protein